jgi:hypothetical protein
MEIRKQILGIVIGIFITISIITPVYSYNIYTNVCDLNATELREVVMSAVDTCRITNIDTISCW